MHTHFSAIHAVGFFLSVVVLGTLWRLISATLVASNRPALSNLGTAMAFQY